MIFFAYVIGIYYFYYYKPKDMIKTVEYKGIEFIVDYDVEKGFPATENHPGDGDEITINSVYTNEFEFISFFEDLGLLGEIEEEL